ncbi:HpcH/HpaI aldolase/citrate lyase family protein [Sphingomonas sp.]|uniref:HpcH/HpaI aldolase/citrate lyase family protein n=1 Tax=Sphingomonas sp. TaxID=28214 RepID=UPI003D6D32A1
MSIRPRRSALYLPASNLKAIAKARTLPCDVVILDLEDAVAPDAKAVARENAIAAVRDGGFGSRELIVRVNGLDSEWGEADCAALAAVTPDAILVPKVSTAADIAAYARHFDGTLTPLWAMVETALSLLRLDEIASAGRNDHGRLAGLVMGTNDLAKEMGAQLDLSREPFIGALGFAVAAARAYGLVILDGVFNDIDDESGFVSQARQAVKFGFDGKTLIHPRLVEPCNTAFTPDAAAIDWAHRVLGAFDEPANADRGAIRLDGKMVERLHLHQARRTLAAAGLEPV